MRKKTNKELLSIIIDTIPTILSLISMECLVFSLTFEDRIMQKNIIYAIVIVSVALNMALLFRGRNKKSRGTSQLQELIEINQKRKEIDEEITRLSRSLLKSDVGQFVDINRLVFSGQLNEIYSDAIDYKAFLERFGINKNEAIVKSNAAAFLSPFNENGDELFQACQNILGKINIFLQRTDNIVAKDDMLMNIVRLIIRSEIVLVNLNERNTNVYYELGIAHAIGKPTILLAETQFSDNDFKNVGFDVDHKFIVSYLDKEDLEKKLVIQVSRLRGEKQ